MIQNFIFSMQYRVNWGIVDDILRVMGKINTVDIVGVRFIWHTAVSVLQRSIGHQTFSFQSHIYCLNNVHRFCVNKETLLEFPTPFGRCKRTRSHNPVQRPILEYSTSNWWIQCIFSDRWPRSTCPRINQYLSFCKWAEKSVSSKSKATENLKWNTSESCK